MAEHKDSAMAPEIGRPKHGGTADATAREAPETGQVSAAEEGADQAVRFSSQLQEIEPSHALETVETLTPHNPSVELLSAEQQEEIRKISKSLRTESHLQKRRMSNFVFEPVSLPASRVPSNEASGSRTGSISSRHNQSIGSVQTPPLTPAGSSTRDQAKSPSVAPSSEMTPQTSGPHDISATSSSNTSGTNRPSSSGQSTTRPSTISSGSIGGDSKHRPASVFIAGATDSASASRDASPSRGGASGTSTPPGMFSRPFTPAGERDDPYARSKRPPPVRNLDTIDARFVFGGRDSRRSSAIILPTQAGSGPRSTVGEAQGHQRPSSVVQQQQHQHHQKRGSGPTEEAHKHVGSMADLKRFFHIGHSKKHNGASSAAKSAAGSRSGTRTPDQQPQSAAVPFADDHGLQSKYGKFGKVLGSGAGGSVRLMKRPSDGVTFAVKQFREKHSHESEREYAKKVTAEFCIGSTLHHGNIIETMDIIQERGHWYEVMEYAPYDLFAIVMTGKMSREEVACSFLQIVAGVTYLHSMGLAHRDLKLDNVVVNDHGIMKIIDFGSATVFKYPFENDVVLATGIVGSDPYLAPEVYDNSRYDPQPTDIWSLAIIFACMSLRRFPWRAPRLSDNSYKLFVAPPTPGTPLAEAISRRRSQTDGDGTPVDDKSAHSSHVHHHHSTHDSTNPTPSTASTDAASATSRSESLRGPWRLLRLLPRESRNIISLMLEVDPKKRATLDEMVEDPWIANTPVCRQIDHGQIVKATGHTHTLVPGQPSDIPPQTTK